MEDNKVQEAEIVPENITMEKQPLEKKSKFRNKLMLIFILGFLIGIALKIEALKKITIGYNDYLMDIKPQNYDINKMQADLSKRIAEEMQAQDAQNEAGDAGDLENTLAPEDDSQQEAN